MTFDVRLHANGEMSRATPGIIEVYRATFTAPPWDETEEDVQWFGERLLDHAQRSGFRGAVAVDGDTGQSVGFAYGYNVKPGEWWYDVARRALGRASERRWLGDSFEFVELAVAPSARANGIGGSLHDLLLKGLSCRTAILTTLDEDTPATRLYRSRGWVTLVTGFVYPGNEKGCLLMGLDLMP
jgi:ribosomal protein S18 acetylase RimI-like enzyme